MFLGGTVYSAKDGPGGPILGGTTYSMTVQKVGVIMVTVAFYSPISDLPHLLRVGVSRQQSQSSFLVSAGGLRISKTVQQSYIYDLSHT